MQLRAIARRRAVLATLLIAVLPAVSHSAAPRAAAPGGGYWAVASDGGVFTFGNAVFLGSTGGLRLNQPVVGMAATPTGNGYWLVASDGGIFAFGDARFRGSGATVARAPVVGIARTPTGNGYWLATSDGAVLAFGDAGDHGGASGALGRRHVVALAAEPGGGGYWLLVGPALETPLGPGATGLAVADLQHELEARRYFVGTRDGVYGLTTSQAVTAVQKVWGLPRTAVFDAATRDALLRGTPPAPLGGDLAFVDLARQVTFIVRQGQTEWVLNVSTGAPSTPTRPGSWTLYRADGGRTASCNGCLYRPRFFDGGRAFHGYVSVPTYPASHGCVRVTNAAMDLMWAENLLPMGSRVVVA